MRAERVAAPPHSRSVQTGAAQQRIIRTGAHRSVGRESFDDGAAHHSEERDGGETVVGKEAETGSPVAKLRAAGGGQARHGMPSQTEQGTQLEGLGVHGAATLVEARAALAPEMLEMGTDAGRVFSAPEPGVVVRRKASRLLSSMNHSTISPRENSIACTRADGKWIYDCSLSEAALIILIIILYK